MSVKQQTITGIAWSTIARVAQQGLQFLISVALARLLTPQDFGLVAMTAVFTGFAALFNELGFGAALIQHERIEERHLSSVFWLNVLAGFILMVLTIGAAPLIALLYDEPRLSLLTMLIATNFLFGSFGIVPNALMMRALNFRGLALIEAAATLLAGAVAIVLALMGYGVFSLVWQMIISTIGRVVFLWYSSAWRPAFRFSWSAVRELLGFSTNLLGFSTFNYWVRKADDLLIGKFVGSAGLGVYTRAYSIMLLPLNQVSSVVSRVMFPTLSQIKDDRRRVKRIYLRSISIVALITFPMMLGLLVVSESFVLALYGLQWKEIIPLLRMLSLVGLAQSIGTTTGWIYQSQGRTDWMFRWGVASGIVTLISFAIGIRWGVLGVAIAYVVRTFALTYFNFSIPGRLIDMSFSDVVRVVAGIFGCALAMAFVVWGLGLVLPPMWSHSLRLAAQFPVGVIVFGALIHVFRVPAYLDARELLLEQVRNRFPISNEIPTALPVPTGPKVDEE